MNEPTEPSISPSESNNEERGNTVEKLESVYNVQYGEYKYYAGQVFVFKDGDVANKTLLIKPAGEVKNHDQRPYLKFRARPVYEGDSIGELNETINDWNEEDEWYHEQFGNIPGLTLPTEKFSICEDPMGSDNKTVLVSTQWIDNIQSDIFKIDAEKLHTYLTDYPSFKETLTLLISKFLELSKEDIYPDYLGTDNVAIYTEEGVPKIALIDKHIVWVGKHCNKLVKGRLDRAITKFERFMEDPNNIENINYLTGKG